jgi:hypothetical protein
MCTRSFSSLGWMIVEMKWVIMGKYVLQCNVGFLSGNLLYVRLEKTGSSNYEQAAGTGE